jgi:hypothetical protein
MSASPQAGLTVPAMTCQSRAAALERFELAEPANRA